MTDPDTKDLIIICDAYADDQITHEEFHARLAARRDRKIERQAQERQNRPHLSPLTGR